MIQNQIITEFKSKSLTQFDHIEDLQNIKLLI